MNNILNIPNTGKSNKNLLKFISNKRMANPQGDKEEMTNHLLILKKASLAGVVVKGIKETLKAIEANKCQVVFVSRDCEDDSYKKCIREFCDMYSVSLIETDNKYQIRDAVMLGEPSYILIEKAKASGKTLKIMPNCYCAAILKHGDINEKYRENN